jgi:hypothetical protein
LAEEREARRRADTLLAGLMDRMHRSILCYSPECVESEFCELRHDEVRRSSPTAL